MIRLISTKWIHATQEISLMRASGPSPLLAVHSLESQVTSMCRICIVVSDVSTAAASSSYSISYESMMKDLNCTELQVTLGLALYVIGFGIVPLISSSFSEVFTIQFHTNVEHHPAYSFQECGRRPVYIISSFLFLLAEIMNAL